jgi:hypothetical protein
MRLLSSVTVKTDLGVVFRLDWSEFNWTLE